MSIEYFVLRKKPIIMNEINYWAQLYMYTKVAEKNSNKNKWYN